MIHLIDSNVYIHAFRHSTFGESLREFHRQHLPRLILSAVVVHELLVGADNQTKERSLKRGIVEPFRARRRLHAPSYQTWETAANIDARLRKQTDLRSKLQTRSFANDILIAASARELGAIILTENSDDFAIIASVLDIRLVKPEEAFLKSPTVGPEGQAGS
jgi:predicted nucleic acid-binding protein